MALKYNYSDICNWVWQKEATNALRKKVKVLNLVRKQDKTKLYAEAARPYSQGRHTVCEIVKEEKESRLFVTGTTMV